MGLQLRRYVQQNGGLLESRHVDRPKTEILFLRSGQTGA